MIAKAETGERPPTADVLHAWSAACQLDLDLLARLASMQDQLTHVAEVSACAYISVQVVPASHGANAGLGGGMTLASGDGTPDVLYMDAVEGQTSEKRSLVRQAAVAFERVRGDAISRGQSRDLILRLADERWKP